MKTNNTYKRKNIYISNASTKAKTQGKNQQKNSARTCPGIVRVLSETCPAMSGIDADCNSRSDPDISRTI